MDVGENVVQDKVRMAGAIGKVRRRGKYQGSGMDWITWI